MSSLPSNLKPIGHYIKIANEHSKRDPVIYYWCLVYAVENGMKIDRKTPECTKYLGGLLSTLEQVKKSLAEEDAVKSDVVGQAHIEEYALKLFMHADNEDRAGRFNKNVVKAFYTSGHLMDLLTLFGDEMDEQMAANRKYAKWKAAYIHNCLKSGETPIPGPMRDPNDPEENTGDETNLTIPQIGGQQAPGQPGFSSQVQPHPFEVPGSGSVAVPPPAASTSQPAPFATEAPTDQGGLDFNTVSSVQKLCKHAISALEYEDKATAKTKLEEALRLLNL